MILHCAKSRIKTESKTQGSQRQIKKTILLSKCAVPENKRSRFIKNEKQLHC